MNLSAKLGVIAVTCALLSVRPSPTFGQETEYERLWKQAIEKENERAAVLSSVNNLLTAKTAEGRFKALTGEGDTILRRLNSREVKNAVPEGQLGPLFDKYSKEWQQALLRTTKEGKRLEALPDGPAIGEILRVDREGQAKPPSAGPAGAPGQPPTHAPASPSPPGPGPAPAPPSAPGTLVPRSHAAPETAGYAVLLPLLMLAIVAACAGTLYVEGMWSNALRLVNVVFAALLATNFWEPLARVAEDWQPSFTFFWDFLCLWGLFGLFMVVLRALTDLISRVKVRFLKIADRIGSAFFGFWVGYVMVCFTMFTLHTAPLAERFLGGGFKPGEANFFFLSPDLQWAGFVQKMSLGPFCRGLGEDEIARYGATDKESEKDTAVFDRNGDFVPKYAARRRALEAHLQQTSTPRVEDSQVMKR